MKPRIGVSIGDINGIGLEVALKALAEQHFTQHATPVLYGSSRVVTYHRDRVGLKRVQFSSGRGIGEIYEEQINVIDCWGDEQIDVEFGKLCAEGGKFAGISLKSAVDDLVSGNLDMLVTAPINKKAMQLSGFAHPGHTEYLQERAGQKTSLMMMVHDNLRVALATNHEPLNRVANMVQRDLIVDKVNVFERSLKMDFGLEKPIIAVLGLNPHAGDGGSIGDEEERHVRPAVLSLKKQGKLVMGPFPADGFFGSGEYKKYDGILAMYHDQGLIPFKTLSFGRGVNFTAGLPFVRTSPDHGTGFAIAGKGEADPGSFREALYLAMDIQRNRARYSGEFVD